VAAASRLSTRVLLICAAIGVATGVLSAVWALMHGVVVATAIFAYGLVLGFHALPGVIAQQVLRQRWVALLTHAFAALVAAALAPAFAQAYLLAALLFGGVQEGVSALTRYRHWEAWRFLVSGAAVGVVLAVPLWFAFDVASYAAWVQIAFVGGFVIGPVAWSAVGLAVGAGLRRAGVAPRLP
jgi:energy-coupling factor transport system permease protein